jgi:hypothetical protein
VGSIGVGSDGIVEAPKKKTILGRFVRHIHLEGEQAPAKKKTNKLRYI